MTAEHSYATLRAYERCLAGLIADPDATGDLLLIGTWLARATILNDPEPGDGRWSLVAITAALYGKGRPITISGMGTQVTVPHHLLHRVQKTLRDDRPRYDPMLDNPRETTCGGPMKRRPLCGKKPITWGYVTDLATGRRVEIGACGQHHRWFTEATAANRSAVQAAGEALPKPAANAGGVLARHISLNWPSLWRSLDKDWTPPAEGTPTCKPQLVVIRNDDFQPVVAARPALVVHQGGWR